jgi:hypothetical protein
VIAVARSGIDQLSPYELPQLFDLPGLVVLKVQRVDEAVVLAHQLDVGRVGDCVAALVLGQLIVEGLPELRRGRDSRWAAAISSSPDVPPGASDAYC